MSLHYLVKYLCSKNRHARRGSRILQGRVSNPSERGTARPQLFWPMLPEPNNFFGLKRNSWDQAVVRHLELYQIPYWVPVVPASSSRSTCWAKNRNDMFSKYVLFKKGRLNKRAGVWTPWTPPGSTTDHAREVIEANCHVRLSHSKKSLKIFVW